MFKVLIIGLKNGKNLGDVVISECTEFLVKKIAKELQISDLECKSIDMTEEDYSDISDYNLVIMAGGGIIKFKYQEFYRYIDKITSIADEAGVPVIFNAVGVEGFDQEDERCKILRRAINRACVRQITTRDDIQLLDQNYILNTDIRTEKVADSAVWTGDRYKIKKNRESNITGLGVVREGIFRSNGIDIGLEEQLQLWEGIIRELEEKGEDWRIFTTGWPSDMKFAINLMNYLGRQDEIKKRVIKEPETPEELIGILSEFKGVIAGRLHANIISYALKIPAIGLVWNEKCALWGETIGYPQRYFRHYDFDAVAMVEQYERALEEGYKEEEREAYKATTYESLREIIREFANQTKSGEI
ncbi:MAG: polysaccharide pyruvyl transferase family protein [Lachnospiraceae bacterium]|nr:polysaccharide pyruvyl transferase family protein [Lachnospiraceae bacterium]